MPVTIQLVQQTKKGETKKEKLKIGPGETQDFMALLAACLGLPATTISVVNNSSVRVIRSRRARKRIRARKKLSAQLLSKYTGSLADVSSFVIEIPVDLPRGLGELPSLKIAKSLKSLRRDFAQPPEAASTAPSLLSVADEPVMASETMAGDSPPAPQGIFDIDYDVHTRQQIAEGRKKFLAESNRLIAELRSKQAG